MAPRLNRRDFLTLTAGAVTAPLWLPRAARAQSSEKATVVLVFLDGGYSCAFSAADACVASNLFGATENNVVNLGNGLVVDKDTLGSLPTSVRDTMCTVGAWHGYPDHINGKRVWWNDSRGASYPLRLAKAIGGTAPLRCVGFSQSPWPQEPLEDLSISMIPDLSGALVAAGANSTPGAPSRDLLARTIEASSLYSRRAITKSPNQLRDYHASLRTVRNMLEAPPRAIDWTEIATAYGLPPASGTISTFTEKLAAAEVMTRAGADVVVINDSGRGVVEGGDWDNHGDLDGSQARAMMTDRLRPLTTFLTRTLALAGHNVVTALYADFARSATSEHAGGLSATVFGKRLKNASTGRASFQNREAYKLPLGSPGPEAFFALVAEAADVSGEPFGVNPHRLLLR